MKSPLPFLTKITSFSLLSSLLIGGISLSSTLFSSPQVNAQSIENSRFRDINIREQGYLNKRGRETYEFRGRENQNVTISLRSNQFNTYLELYNPSGRLIARNDNANGTNSQISLNLPSTGTYTVVAKGAKRNDEGNYTLIIKSNSDSRLPRRPEEPTLPPGHVNYRHKNYLFRGESVKHDFQANRGEFIKITLASRQFNPHIILHDSNGGVLTEGKSEIQMKLPRTGVYTVEVKGIDLDAQGEYTLTIVNK
jgi:hypothetical protein